MKNILLNSVMTTIDRGYEIVEISISPIFVKNTNGDNEFNILDDTYSLSKGDKYIETEIYTLSGSVYFAVVNCESPIFGKYEKGNTIEN